MLCGYMYRCAFFDLTIQAAEGALYAVTFAPSLDDGVAVCETPLIKAARGQIEQYLAKERKAFDLPLAARGTVFQRAVWAALAAIPYGQTRSYRDVAAAAGNPSACRAVGGAAHRNPFAIVVPCHRVIGADGSLTGFSGGLAVKRRLLELEGYAGATKP